MGERLDNAKVYLEKVAFPPMYLGSNGEIWMEDDVSLRVVATMNLRDLTLTEAFAFASAFIAAGEAMDAARPATPDEDTPHGGKHGGSVE